LSEGAEKWERVADLETNMERMSEAGVLQGQVKTSKDTIPSIWTVSGADEVTPPLLAP
jgi:hypothetical protein